MSIGERFAKALEKIYGKRNSNKVAEEFNITPQAIGQLKKKNTLTETVCLISEKKKINLNWLFTGQGEMFINDNEIKIESSIKSINNFNESNNPSNEAIEDFKILERKNQKAIHLEILKKLSEEGKI